MRRRNPLIVSVALAAIGTGLGCVSKQKQLENVAKDWCLTIRASQVIPVYPLTEDLQPGDVFLVEVPVDRQQEIYRDKGFLPLDNHLARLDPEHFGAFYDRSFISDGELLTLPRDWMRPAGADAQSWLVAPNAAFPTYSFSVSQGSGLNLAIPISGVPVGLSMLGTQSANGSVSIGDSRTLGIDTVTIYEQLMDWADHNRGFLAHFGTVPGHPPRNYVRVVTRIYTTGELDVQLSDSSTFGAGGDVGVARPVDLFLPTLADESTSTREAARLSYERSLAHLNSMAGARGTPMHVSGDDVGLTTEELESRAKARAAELERQKADAKATQATKQQAAQQARSDAQAETEALRTATRDYDDAQARVRAAERALDSARIHRDGLSSDAPEADVSAADEQMIEAQNELNTAKTYLNSKQSALETAREIYKPQAEAIAKSDVELASANAALERLEGFAPGGSFRFNAVSSRSVSLTQRFDPPLIIGYLGFDVPILAGGGLGRPIPTRAILDSSLQLDLEAQSRIGRQLADSSILNAMYDAIADDDSFTAQSIKSRLDSLTEFIPDSFREVKRESQPGTYKLEPVNLNLHADGRFDFLDYVHFWEMRETNLRILNRILGARSLQVPDDRGGYRPGGRADYRTLQKDIRSFEITARERQAFDDARRDLFAYYTVTTATMP